MKRWLSPVWFVLIAAAFLFPFVTISCQAPAGLGDLGALGGEDAEIPSGDILKATGWQLVTGDVEVASDFGQATQGGEPAGTEEQGPAPFAIAALAAAVLGIFLSPLRARLGGIFTLVFGALVGIFLILLRLSISGDLPTEAETFLKVSYKVGYWAALLLGIIAALWGVLRIVTHEDVVGIPAPPATGMPPPMGTTTGTGFESPPGTAPPPGPTSFPGPPPAPPPGGSEGGGMGGTEERPPPA